jgi:flagellar biosynthesis anti-sigma factor FlgM
MISDKVNLSGANIAQAGRTTGTAGAENARNTARSTGTAERGDEVRLSGLAGRIAGAMDADASQRASRVAELTATVQSGRYEVNARAVASAMLDESLASHASGE